MDKSTHFPGRSHIDFILSHSLSPFNVSSAPAFKKTITPTPLSVQITPMNNLMLQAVAHLHTPNSILLHCSQKDVHSVLDTVLSIYQCFTELDNKMFKSLEIFFFNL